MVSCDSAPEGCFLQASLTDKKAAWAPIYQPFGSLNQAGFWIFWPFFVFDEVSTKTAKIRAMRTCGEACDQDGLNLMRVMVDDDVLLGGMWLG